MVRSRARPGRGGFGLGDLMDRLRDEAAAEDVELVRILGEAVRANPASDIEKVMQQTPGKQRPAEHRHAQQNAHDASPQT